jgi:alpha-tubulin suppressor-like RCC1 family protein
MRKSTKDKRFFIMAVSLCFFLSALVSPISLYATGEITAWGNNDYSQCDVPEPNTAFTDIEGGGYHSLGLKADSSIVAWGHHNDGQCTVPEPNTGFTAISAG